MSIQYSGNVQTSTFTPATKQDIINGVETALLAAGWSTVSGHATTNLLMQSAATPQGFAIRVRLKDNNGTCVQFSLESTDGVLVGSNSTGNAGGHLNPNSGGWVYKVVGSKYQVFIFATPYPGAARSFVAFGVPWVPSWVASITTRAGWMVSNGDSDTSTSVDCSLRTTLSILNSNGTSSSQQAMYNGTLWSAQTGNRGVIALPSMQAVANNWGENGVSWVDGSYLIIDALISWAIAGTGNTGQYIGQLWDAVITTGKFPADTVTAFDGHDALVFTNNDATPVQGGYGSLLIATD